MIEISLAILSYYAIGTLYMAACIPAIRRDAARLRRHGKRTSIPLALAKAFWAWPMYLVRRGHSRDEDPQAKVVPLVTYHKPDYDRIAELERENGIG